MTSARLSSWPQWGPRGRPLHSMTTSVAWPHRPPCLHPIHTTSNIKHLFLFLGHWWTYSEMYRTNFWQLVKMAWTYTYKKIECRTIALNHLYGEINTKRYHKVYFSYSLNVSLVIAYATTISTILDWYKKFDSNLPVFFIWCLNDQDELAW